MSTIQDQQSYTLTNCKGGTVLDLSGMDNHTVIGYQSNNGTNQQWVFERADAFWYILSVRSQQYLGIDGDISSAQNGTRVIAVPSPFAWTVENSDVSGAQGIRILANDTNFSLDLDCGNSANNTKVHLWDRWHCANQIWAATAL